MNDESQTSAYRRLIEIGIALSAEKGLKSLLQHILLEAKSMANADAATVYLNTGQDSLKFSIVLNDTLGIAQGGATGEPVSLPDIPLTREDGKPNLGNIASSAAHRGSTIVVSDARTSQEFDFSGTRRFDEMLGYRTKSFLTIHLIEALASQASVAIENRTLIDEQEALKKQLEREVDARTEELQQALTKLSEAHIILKELNTIDAVTGIRNRQYFDEVLDLEWRRARRQGYDLSLLMLDIDHFKKIFARRFRKPPTSPMATTCTSRSVSVSPRSRRMKMRRQGT